MRRPVCYDVTRLLTRILNATPNGIDRVDYALADHCLAGAPETTFGATATGVGARLIRGPAAAEAIAGIAAHWGERCTRGDDDPTYRRVVERLTDHGLSGVLPGRRSKRSRQVHLGGMADWLRRHGLPWRDTPRAKLPPRSVYVNASQFPLWVASSFEWLEARTDVRAAFFIHDLLPIHYPEYFRKAEFERHQSRLRNFARFAAAGIVTTRTVAADLEEHLATLGRKDIAIFVKPTPIAPIFSTPRDIDPTLEGCRYFVLCSTIEPRKNHLMILAVWRALVQRLGRHAPKLVLVGTRGWHFAPIVDLVARSPALRGSVVEVNGLSTPGLKRLMDNACAVLMPSFAEGYGLPVHEALVAGAPVIASDIPAFRECAASGLTLLSPLDGEAWLETIAARATMERPESAARPGAEGWSSYFEAFDDFLDGL